MSEITPEDSERIIEAAAQGLPADSHPEVAAALTSLHAPADSVGVAPSIAAAGPGLTGRIARRTAVAASAAILGLAGVAAAATTGIDLLDPLLGDDGPALVELDEDDAPASTTTTSTTVAPVAPVDDDDDDEVQRDGTEIEGVDPSDGLDDEELALACEAVENHGEYVSMVARDRITETDGTHGARVSEAAESNCGRDDVEEESDAGGDDDVIADDNSDGDDTDEGDDDDDRGNSQGSDNGRGRENGEDHADRDRPDSEQNPGRGNGNRP
jgi:hypothetical protein